MLEMTLKELWNAGHVNRWHNNANHALRNSGDTVWQHSARVAFLASRLFPDLTVADIVAAIEHDLHECVTGDMPGPAKKNPHIRAYLGEIEEKFNIANGIDDDPDAYDKVKLCDVLDAYLWAGHVAPAELVEDAWMDQYFAILHRADELGVMEQVKEVMDNA